MKKVLKHAKKNSNKIIAWILIVMTLVTTCSTAIYTLL